MSVKPFDKPEQNYTVFHNVIFDEVMKLCTSSEWKVLCVILRKTRGWNKDHDFISYSQILESSGIASYSTIKKAIDGLCKKEMILIKTGDVSTSNYYRLNIEYQPPITETVAPPITETVAPPITETVDTKNNIKDSVKENKCVGKTDLAKPKSNQPQNNPEPDKHPDISDDTAQTDERLLSKFEAVTRIMRPIELRDPYQLTKWLKEVGNWTDLGATEADISAAVEEADQRGTTLAWPGSITSYLKSAIARRERGVKSQPSKPAKGKQQKTNKEIIREMIENGRH